MLRILPFFLIACTIGENIKSSSTVDVNDFDEENDEESEPESNNQPESTSQPESNAEPEGQPESSQQPSSEPSSQPAASVDPPGPNGRVDDIFRRHSATDPGGTATDDADPGPADLEFFLQSPECPGCS